MSKNLGKGELFNGRGGSKRNWREKKKGREK